MAKRLLKHQRLIADYLESGALELSRVFVTGARLRNDDSFPARGYFIAHALRELINRLPDYYLGELDRDKKHAEDFKQAWFKEVEPQLPEAVVTSESPSSPILLSRTLAADIHGAMLRAADVPRVRQERFAMFLGHLQDSDSTLFADIAKLFIRDRLVDYAHVPMPAKLREHDVVLSLWDTFEKRMIGVIGPQHEAYSGIEATLASFNESTTDHQFLNFLESLATPQHRLYFFERLKDPRWLDLLRAKNYYANPPTTKTEGSSTVIPLWPQAEYLTNIAASRPADVTAVLSTIETNNPAVVSQLCKAIMQVSATTAKRATRSLRKMLGNVTRFQWASYTYTDVIDFFAKGGATGEALHLTRDALALMPKDSALGLFLGKSRFDAVALLGDENLDYILEHSRRSLLDSCPLDYITAIAKALESALRIEGAYARCDYSSSWASDLTAPALGNGAKESLAYHLRESIDLSIRKALLTTDQVATLLGEFTPDVYFRILLLALHTAGETAAFKKKLRLARFYTNVDLGPERKQLLPMYFSRSTALEQEKIIGRIRHACDRERSIRRFLRDKCEEPELSERIRNIQEQDLFEQLEPLEPYLKGAVSIEFSKLKARFDWPGREYAEKTWIGPTAPKSTSDLVRMPTTEIMSYLETWIPQQGWFQATPEGLGRMLEPIVADRFSDFMEDPDRLCRLRSTYLVHALQALQTKIADENFPIGAFLDLLIKASARRGEDKAATELDDNADDDAEDHDEGRASSRARQQVAFSLSALLKSKRLTIAMRAKVWKALLPTLEDLDPSPLQESDFLGASKRGSPSSLALNSARGAAMLGLFDYAYWLYVELDIFERGLDLSDQAPELFEAMDDRLDPKVDPSVAIRSTFGQRFATLYGMSKDWSSKNASRIFTRDAAGDAAWTAFLKYNRAHSKTYALLSERYLDTVRSLANAHPEGDDDESVAADLGSHLSILHIRSAEDIDESVFAEFLNLAPPKAVKRALRTLAQPLCSNEPLSATVLRRFEAVYDHIFDLYCKRSMDSRTDVLGTFGLWVLSQKLEGPWLLERLRSTLEATAGSIEMVHRVVDRLAEIMPSFPEGTMTALYGLSFGNLTSLFTGESAVRSMLVAAVSAGGLPAELAIKTTDRFTRMGYLAYNDIFTRKAKRRHALDRPQGDAACTK